MKKGIKSPRVLQINSVKGFTVSCVFNNGEKRHIDFEKMFNEWKITKEDPEYRLLKPEVFKKIRLRNNTLSWDNIKVTLTDSTGRGVAHPYEIDPVTLYKHSKPAENAIRIFSIGKDIKKERLQQGLSQDELAALSGTSKTYISRIENNHIVPELHTLYKIVEIGLGKKIQLKIS